jgi:transposase
MPITHFTLGSLADISLMKTLRSQKLRMLLVHRKLLQSKSIAIENDLRGTLRNFELKVGVAGTAKFEARIR